MFDVVPTTRWWPSEPASSPWFDGGDALQQVAIRFPAVNPLEIGRPDDFPHAQIENGQEAAVGVLIAEVRINIPETISQFDTAAQIRYALGHGTATLTRFLAWCTDDPVVLEGEQEATV